MAEEAHREAMLRALAEADAAHQLMPDLRRGGSDRQVDLPLLPSDSIEPVATTEMTPATPTPDIRIETEGSELSVDQDHDVTMTQ